MALPSAVISVDNCEEVPEEPDAEFEDELVDELAVGGIWFNC